RSHAARHRPPGPRRALPPRPPPPPRPGRRPLLHAQAQEGPHAVSLSTRTPMSDAQRVLGQIERGEVRAGAEAARQIAAKHQAAYGDAVWGPTASTTTDSVSGDQ